MSNPNLRKKTKRFYIEYVEVANNYASSSEAFGFGEDVQDSYDADIVDLQKIWEAQGYVEIYDKEFHGNRAFYPLAKDSNCVPGSSPHYTGLYHARLLSSGENDPLVIVTFQGVIIDQERYEKAVIEALITHDVMFLEKGRKSQEDMKIQGRWVRKKI